MMSPQEVWRAGGNVLVVAPNRSLAAMKFVNWKHQAGSAHIAVANPGKLTIRSQTGGIAMFVPADVDVLRLCGIDFDRVIGEQLATPDAQVRIASRLRGKLVNA
jgi:hypothetical protein